MRDARATFCSCAVTVNQSLEQRREDPRLRRSRVGVRIEILWLDPVAVVEDAVADSRLDSRFLATTAGEEKQGGQQEKQSDSKRHQWVGKMSRE